MDTVHLIVAGCHGRMGQMILKLIAQDSRLKLVGALESARSPSLGKDAGVNAGIDPFNVKITNDLTALTVPHQTVLIDFSTIESTLINLEKAAQKKIPVVIGTTGFTESDKQIIATLSQKIPVILSPNMSVGVNVLLDLIAQAGKILKDEFDIEITEIHHKHKIDAPSGTAMKMAEVLCESTGRSVSTDLNYHRQGVVGKRTQKEIGMQTLRGGDVVGEHTAYFFGEGERIEIKHVATSRATFAAGSLRAAKWLLSKSCGLYSMKDVLGLS